MSKQKGQWCINWLHPHNDERVTDSQFSYYILHPNIYLHYSLVQLCKSDFQYYLPSISFDISSLVLNKMYIYIQMKFLS